MMSSGDWP
uniref:Uncharacterized protein n=1 Tax=Moniliophthora roreri TaxID=221103 RepID=A0A0W0FE39_MONRR